MSRLTSESEMNLSRRAQDERRGRSLTERPRYEATSSDLLVAGLVAAGGAGRPGLVLLRPGPAALPEDQEHVTAAGEVCTSCPSR